MANLKATDFEEQGTMTYTGGWTCPYCAQWVPAGTLHDCHWFPPTTTWLYEGSSSESAAPKALRLLMRLFEEGIIPFPESFEEFKRILEILESEMT